MDIVNEILSQSTTKDAALRLVSELEEKQQKELYSGVGARSSRPENGSVDFAAAREEIAAIEPLYLYLPVEFPQETLKEIVAKLRQDFGVNMLLEIKLDRDLIGGCALSYKGVYKDYSLRSRFAEKMEELKQIIWK